MTSIPAVSTPTSAFEFGVPYPEDYSKEIEEIAQLFSNKSIITDAYKEFQASTEHELAGTYTWINQKAVLVSNKTLQFKAKVINALYEETIKQNRKHSLVKIFYGSTSKFLNSLEQHTSNFTFLKNIKTIVDLRVKLEQDSKINIENVNKLIDLNDVEYVVNFLKTNRKKIANQISKALLSNVYLHLVTLDNHELASQICSELGSDKWTSLAEILWEEMPTKEKFCELFQKIMHEEISNLSSSDLFEKNNSYMKLTSLFTALYNIESQKGKVYAETRGVARMEGRDFGLIGYGYVTLDRFSAMFPKNQLDRIIEGMPLEARPLQYAQFEEIIQEQIIPSSDVVMSDEQLQAIKQSLEAQRPEDDSEEDDEIEASIIMGLSDRLSSSKSKFLDKV